MNKRKAMSISCLTLSIINFIMATIWIIVVATAMLSPNLDKANNVFLDIVETFSIFGVLIANGVVLLLAFIHFKNKKQVK